MLMAALGIGYLYLHGPFFDTYATPFLATFGLYVLYNLYIIYSIRRYPVSPGRLLVSPILDAYLVSFGLVIDGGNISGLSLIYLVIILGNAFRYGNMMMLYTQALCLAGLVGAAILSLQQLQTNTIWSLLGFQAAALLLLPPYAMSLAYRFSSARHAPEQAEQNVPALLDLAPLPMFTYHLDAQGSPRILHANAALQAVCRDPIDRLVNEQVDMLALPEDGGIIVSECRQALQQKASASSRFYIRGRNASDTLLNLTGEVARVRWQSQWIGLCFLIDTSEQSQHTAYENSFVSGIVHDLRNILTGIIGQAEIVQMDIQDTTLKQRLDPVIEAGERGADMTARLLDLSGLRPVPKRGQPQATDIHASLEKMIDLVRLQLPEKVALTCHADPDLATPGIQISELEQIIMNLIQNAYQAIPDTGSIDVSITAAADSIPAGIVIRVKDTGSGIASENLDKIFATFWTTRKDRGNTGLGLSVVRQIVQRHQGHIDVQSTPEQGSEFTVHLPTDTQASQQSGATSQNSAGSGAVQNTDEAVPTTPWRILLVDDSPVVLKVHQAMLTRMGHRVVAVPDAQTALTYFEQPESDSFDLILTDYMMPGMNGLQLIRQLRNLGVHLPIMVITAYGEEDRLHQLPNLGAGVIHKPVSYRALSAHIAAIQTSRGTRPTQPVQSPINSDAQKSA